MDQSCSAHATTLCQAQIQIEIKPMAGGTGQWVLSHVAHRGELLLTYIVSGLRAYQHIHMQK